jgi:hypothetical protein
MPEVSAVEAFVPRVVVPSSAIVVEEESMRAQAVAIESRAQKSHEELLSYLPPIRPAMSSRMRAQELLSL